VLKSDKHHNPVSLAQVAVLDSVPHKQAAASLATEALVLVQTRRPLAQQKHPSAPAELQKPVAAVLVLKYRLSLVSLQQPGG